MTAGFTDHTLTRPKAVDLCVAGGCDSRASCDRVAPEKSQIHATCNSRKTFCSVCLNCLGPAIWSLRSALCLWDGICVCAAVRGRTLCGLCTTHSSHERDSLATPSSTAYMRRITASHGVALSRGTFVGVRSDTRARLAVLSLTSDPPSRRAARARSPRRVRRDERAAPSLSERDSYGV